jgi:hypothetical protein
MKKQLMTVVAIFLLAGVALASAMSGAVQHDPTNVSMTGP